MKIQKQKGAVLIVGLLLLLVMIVIGVATMSSAHMQERMAGNANLQSIAFETASAGATDAINFFDVNRTLGEDELCGAREHEGWDAPTDWVNRGVVGGAVLRQRMYCLSDEYPDESGGRPLRSQLFVLSRGEVLAGGVPVAVRDIEVRLVIGDLGPAGDGCGAICFPACGADVVDFPTSHPFRVDGEGGPAVTAGCQETTDQLIGAVASNRIGNYIGGIETVAPGMPWDSPTQVELFRENVEQAAQAAQAGGGCPDGACYNTENVNANGHETFGTVASPQITYVDGNADMGGNVTGAGLMVVNGDLSWNGTPAFEGLIVVLGGTFTQNGGGIGGIHAGQLVVLNADGGSEFGDINFLTSGGGSADFTHNCSALWIAHYMLDSTGQSLWNPECEIGPQNPFEADADQLAIASWRENIGWREESLYGSD